VKGSKTRRMMERDGNDHEMDKGGGQSLGK